MKIGVFSDSHYCHAERLCDRRLCSRSLKKIEQALDEFEKEKVDVCVSLGDLIDHYQDRDGSRALLGEVANLIKGRPFPFLHASGNHDYACLPPDEIAEILGIGIPPYTVETCGYRFIVLDGNYTSEMRCYADTPFNWTDSNLPPEQLQYLEKELESSELPCIVMVHEPLDPGTDDSHCINNAEQARNIIAKSGKVSLVLQGHFHCGADHVIDGIRYFTMDAMCEGEENHYTVIEV